MRRISIAGKFYEENYSFVGDEVTVTVRNKVHPEISLLPHPKLTHTAKATMMAGKIVIDNDALISGIADCVFFLWQSRQPYLVCSLPSLVLYRK